VVADLPERTRDAVGVARVLHGGRVGEELALAADRSLDQAPEQHAERISLTFSLKESLFKALYPLVLRRFYFQDAELLSVDADNKVRMRLLIDLHPNWPVGSELEGQFTKFDGYLLSLISIATATARR
jgi:enterobactin synthetase component D